MKISTQPKTRFITQVAIKHAQESSFTRKNQQKDTLSIGLQARHLFNGQQQKNALMDSLMKQRESIQEMKSSLTERALEKGTDPSSIKEQMKALETQLADIDAQIAQTQKQKQEQDAPTTKKEMNQTPEEAIFSQAGSLEQTKTLHRIDRSLTREKAAIESEMKLDASRGVHSEYKANRLIKVEEQMTLVQEELSERIKESPTTIQNSNLSEALTADELSIQEQIRENEIKKSEDNNDTLV
ncbi:hypothetical protein NSQ62_09540 [Solibacillus sp. FSL H8-0523]|uniref:hypothetical protein n=1 Tax=Solibacillus sp. FSL H8-0523 TaxID=2954511 RepID=UPI003100C902